MAFDDLRELVDAQPLKLPIGGKVYVVEPCSAEVWLKLQTIGERMDEITQAKKEGKEVDTSIGTKPVDLFRMTLGGTFDKMVKDGVRGDELSTAGYTAFFWQIGNEAMAEATWKLAGKALTPAQPNRATRRAATKKPASRTSRATSASSRARTARN